MEEPIMKDDKRIEPTNDGEGVIEQRAGEKEPRPMMVRVWKAMTRIKKSLAREP